MTATVVANVESLSRFSGEARPENLALYITMLLQTTLDLGRQIELFAGEMQKVIPYESLSYAHDEYGIFVNEGTPARHSCAYRLTVEGRQLGQIRFSRGKRFQEKEIHLIEMLLCSLIYPLRNAIEYRHVLEEARRDPLTGAANRQVLETTLAREAALAHRHQAPLSVIFLDIDNFKSINDSCGHAAGDQAIHALIGCIQSRIRNTDLLARYGGDEFVVVLNNTPLEGARLLAEHIREAVEAVDGDSIAPGLKLRSSLGVATLTVGETAAELIGRADRSLVLAKQLGRNCVVC